MKKLIGLVAAALLIGVGFWAGRSRDVESARAEPAPVATVPTAPAHGAVPKLAPARPVLARPAPVPGLAADLVSDNATIRRAAIREVVRSAEPDPQTLIAASRDSDGDVARTAMAALAKLYADGRIGVRELGERVADRSLDARVRSVALNGLGTVPDPDAAKLLVQLAATGDAFERRTAVALLGNQDAELAVPALIRALSDGDEYVRGNAHESLVLRSRGRDFGTDAGSWSAWWQSRR